MRLKLILASLCVMSIVACKKETTTTPVEKPTACFTAPKTLVDSGEVITFTNCSKAQKSNLWALASTTSNTGTTTDWTTALMKRGKETVTLTVSNDAGSNIMNKDIQVGKHSIKYLRFNTIPTKDASGANYRPDGKAPIVLAVFGPNANTTSNQTKLYTTATTGPMDLEPTTGNIVINHEGTGKNNSSWTFRIQDENSGTPKTLITFGGSANPIYPSRGALVQKIYSTNGWDIDLVMDLVP
ncbi:MAG: hypothetical protein SGJ04_06170 [Bacteroidota bacterium]|nr:hypothetical protein [Bacteroidota bacterium]